MDFTLPRPNFMIGQLLLKDGLQVIRVDDLQLFFVGIVDGAYANNGREPRG